MTADQTALSRREPSLPFIERYAALRRGIPSMRGVIERCRAHIVSQQAYLAQCEAELAEMESTWAWIQEHRAEDVNALETRWAAMRKRLFCECGEFRHKCQEHGSAAQAQQEAHTAPETTTATQHTGDGDGGFL